MKKLFAMVVYSNPIEGREEEYLKWYMGQHIHDMLHVKGYKGCRYYKIADDQLNGTKASKGYQFMIIWYIEAEDIADVYKEIVKRRESHDITYSDAFDRNTFCTVCEPITNYISSESVLEMSAEEVLKLASEFEG